MSEANYILDRLTSSLVRGTAKEMDQLQFAIVPAAPISIVASTATTQQIAASIVYPVIRNAHATSKIQACGCIPSVNSGYRQCSFVGRQSDGDRRSAAAIPITIAMAAVVTMVRIASYQAACSAWLSVKAIHEEHYHIFGVSARQQSAKLDTFGHRACQEVYPKFQTFTRKFQKFIPQYPFKGSVRRYQASNIRYFLF